VLIAALSLAAIVAIDVPYLPQTDALCGGAAAAMVFRYWGEAHADAQEFAPLVDRRAGGIANGVLTAAVSTRGWRTERVDGTLTAIGARLHDGQPVIVLLPDRGDRYHYVVVTGANEEAIVVHDPAWGPSRTIRAPAFERMWKAAGYWSLVILPRPADGTSRTMRPLSESSPPSPERVHSRASTADEACDARLNHALDEIRSQGLDRADALLGDVRARCPGAAGPIRELSGARFAQRRWSDAAALAREALRLQPGDEYALDVLGSSLFMLNDDIGALRAWNQIGKPRVNRVSIEGLHHIRYQTVAEVMAIQPNMLLTADVFARARRRLGELPDHAATRLAVTPETDGFATVDVVVVELSAVPRGTVEWAGFAARTAANQEIDVSVPGVSGQGEVWTAGWRWWSNRPGVSLGFAAPRVGRLPGVWRFDGSWQSDTYGGEVLEVRGAGCEVRGAACESIVETRTHGGLTVSDWLAHGVRYAVSAGIDAWSGDRKAASIGAALEHVAFGDRLSLSMNAMQWAPLTGEPAFRSLGTRVGARSTSATQGWVARGSFGVERVSDAAPFALWPGAGEGQVRAPLLRAHPLLSDGVVDLSSASAFGRTLAFGSAEVQRWFERPTIAQLGVAMFTDLARASRQAADGRTPVYVDAGAGLRIKIPGTPGVLRADVAHGLRDGANALTFGWLF
jgi:predicted double-glycine peptidase